MPLAQQVSNPGTNGSNARYYIGNLTRGPDGRLTDGTYHYDDNGLSFDRPDSVMGGLPPANSSEAYNVYGAQPSGGGGGGGGGLLGSAMGSPVYQQVLAANQAAAAADAAARKAALEQMLVQFGEIPSGFTDKYGDITSTDRQLAQQGTTAGTSALARLRQALMDANRDASRRLTSKGLRRSGARGYELRRNQLGYDQSYSDALNQLLGNANSIYQQFAGSEYNRSINLANALQSALNSLSYSPPSFTHASVSAPAAQPSAPSYSAPAYQNPSYNVGQTQPSGYSVNTGGGFYTNQQGGDLTAKWQRLAGLS